MAAVQDQTKSASHPPYPDMILAAITDLEEKDGSTKQAISKQIESTYANSLPADHSAILSDTLAKLKDSGKLLFVKNNYQLPDSESQPRRGRGRPPKSKPDLPQVAAFQSPKRSSLLVKNKDPVSASSGKKRGRPPKNSKTNGDSVPAAVVAKSTGQKRGRGRPAKVSSAAAEESSE